MIYDGTRRKVRAVVDDGEGRAVGIKFTRLRPGEEIQVKLGNRTYMFTDKCWSMTMPMRPDSADQNTTFVPELTDKVHDDIVAGSRNG